MTTKWIGANENNYTKGRGKPIKKIVLHWIVGTLESADATFANPDRKASAHYGIANNEIHQYVREEDTAWHASNWGINQESIGIEHEGGWLESDGKRKVPTATTHQTSAKLIADICNRYQLPIDRNTIHVHNEYSATQCPGSLDVNRIIELARQYAQTPTDPEIINNPQAKLDLGEGWGIQELQATKSILNDQKRDLESTKIALEKCMNTDNSKNCQEWQTKLESANTKIGELTQKLQQNEADIVSNMSFWDFISIKLSKGGDGNV